MGAGDGAAEQARMAAERAARLRRQLEHAERAERAWAAGAAGEARVAGIVEALLTKGWMALHDVHWPGRPKANLDHVLVGPGGIIVIDAKNWSGDVHLRDGLLRQNGYSREREVSGVLEQGAAVAALLEPQHRRHVQSWLCMVGQPRLQGSTTSGVQVHGVDGLCASIENLPAVLDAGTVSIIHHYLTRLLTGASSPSLLTTGRLPLGPPDVGLSPGPAVSLARWKTARRDPADDPRTIQPPHLKRAKVRRRQGPGCFGVLFRLALIIFAIGVFLNVLSQLVPQTPSVPVPAPTVAATAPVP